MLKKIINIVFLAALFSTVSIVSHASAMPSSMHHSSAHGTPANCATICLNAPTNDSKREIPANKDEDDNPEIPYFLKFESAQTGWFAEKKFTPRVIEQEDKVPIYQLCCVLRV